MPTAPPTSSTARRLWKALDAHAPGEVRAVPIYPLDASRLAVGTPDGPRFARASFDHLARYGWLEMADGRWRFDVSLPLSQDFIEAGELGDSDSIDVGEFVIVAPLDRPHPSDPA